MHCGAVDDFAPSTWWMISIVKCWRSKWTSTCRQPRIVRTLDRIAAERGYPRKLRLDNGPEMVSVTLADWAEEHNVLLEFIKPGRPMSIFSEYSSS